MNPKQEGESVPNRWVTVASVRVGGEGYDVVRCLKMGREVHFTQYVTKGGVCQGPHTEQQALDLLTRLAELALPPKVPAPRPRVIHPMPTPQLGPVTPNTVRALIENGASDETIAVALELLAEGR